MAFDGILITEIFHSLQGETTLSGLPFAFIRLSGCNLRCTYCDSTYTFKGGTRMSIAEILSKIKDYQVKHVLITGGEPLLQRNTPTLLAALRAEGYEVSIETHGEVSIENVAGKARIVMDVKTPGSGMNRGFAQKNLPLLRAGDEIKFVITSFEDYEFSKNWIHTNTIPAGVELLFSPALSVSGRFDASSVFTVKNLAEAILRDRLPVRFQYQLHKIIWGADVKGV